MVADIKRGPSLTPAQIYIYIYMGHRAGESRETNWFLSCLTLKNAIFWDVTPCGSCKNWRFGGTFSCVFKAQNIRERRKALAGDWRVLKVRTAWSWLVSCVKSILFEASSFRGFGYSVCPTSKRMFGLLLFLWGW
jgi:hypothetical protein